MRGDELEQGVERRVIRKYGIISGRRGRWDLLGEREVQHEEGEDVERRTKLYTRVGRGWPSVEDGRCPFGEGAGS